MKKTKAEELRDSILLQLDKIDVAGYIVEEVELFLRYLHYYKLKNVANNASMLEEYLLMLDKHNTNQLKFLSKTNFSETENIENAEIEPNYSYYMSKDGITQLGKSDLASIFHNVPHLQELKSMMQGIKGLFLLTSNEFCHASNTRMCINKFLWQKQQKKYKMKIAS